MIAPTSPLPAIVALLLALGTVRVLIWRFGAPKSEGRFMTIDGLRGYLAFFVFMHHSCIWFFYIKTSDWQPPPSNFFTGLGQSSVILFFMITSFLFSTKVIEGKKKGVDWLRLYVSRLLRLVPLYLFAMALLFVTVAVVSHFALNESPKALATDALRWIGFSFLGVPDLNGVEGTRLILAGVTWSLPYEWAFYLCLPLLSLAIGAIPAFPILMIGIVGILGFMRLHASPLFLEIFLSGTVTALLVRSARFRRIAQSKVSSVIAAISIISALTLFPTSYSHIPVALLSLSFALIAGGATLFDALISPLSRALGEMAYSIYLLHGFVLFVIFNFISGEKYSGTPSPLWHWALIFSVTPVLVLICFATFHFIEKPPMRCTDGVVRWIRRMMFTRRVVLNEPL